MLDKIARYPRPNEGADVTWAWAIKFTAKPRKYPQRLFFPMFRELHQDTSGGQKFMLLGAGINLSGTLWSAADRIRKLILRGQCGTVRFHAVLN